MGMIAPLDSVFLIQEAREHPMHVAGLQIFKMPPGRDEDYPGELYRELLSYTDVAPMFSRRPRDPVESVGNFWWKAETDVDIDYHVRRSALPRPGRIRELLELVSRLHGSLLDRHRPLWEYHIIEGLPDNRFATYAKVHHSLSDGITLTRKVLQSCSIDPDERGRSPMWSPAEERPKPARQGRIAHRAALRDQTAVLPYEAPKSMLNVPISGSRRVAAQSWDIKRILKVSKARGITLNDMVLAMSAGALRRYLLANDALPDEPLIASIPVSMRTGGEGDGDGNAITFVLCNLATHLSDPEARLEAITSSMRASSPFE